MFFECSGLVILCTLKVTSISLQQCFCGKDIHVQWREVTSHEGVSLRTSSYKNFGISKLASDHQHAENVTSVLLPLAGDVL